MTPPRRLVQIAVQILTFLTEHTMLARLRSLSAPALGLAAILTTMLVPSAMAAVTLGVRVNYATGSGSFGVAVADLNGDGLPDLVTPNSVSANVSVLLGTGAGVYGVKTDFATSVAPVAVAIGDVNGDGKADLAVACQNGGAAVSILLGNGAGSFPVRNDYPTGVTPTALAIGDLNGDGRADLVVTDGNASGYFVSVHLNDGVGGFAIKTDFTVGTTPSSVAIGDLNGDSRLDVVVTNRSSGNVGVLLGDGTGALGAMTTFATGTSPYTLALGDLNGDGKLDVASTNNGASSVSILLGTGSGGFGPKTDYPTSSFPKGIAIGDMNGDGRPDLATHNFTGTNIVSVLEGDGAGAFPTRTDFTTGASPSGVAIADVNGDGRLDLLTSNNSGGGSVSVLVNCSGAVPLGPKFDYTAGNSPRWVTSGDLNADGRPDLVVANMGASTVTVFLGNAVSGFGSGTAFTCGAGPRSVAIGDITGDGKPDLVTANGDVNTISVLPGVGNGTFGAKVDYTAGTVPFSIAIADLNGDTKLDVACANLNSSNISAFLNNGSGGLNAKVDYACGLNPGQVTLVDVSGDGKLDALTANSGASTMSVLLGSGTGTFGAKTDFAAGSAPYTVAAGDFNGDGKQDAAIANNVGNSVSVLIGNGAGSFGAPTNFTTGTAPYTVVAADVNGDGRLDLAAACDVPSVVSVLLGDGAGSFAAKVDLAAGVNTRGLALGDLNGDGRVDVATANANGTASVLVSFGLTTTALSVAPTAPVLGLSMTLTANVTNVSTIISTPSDSVRFFDGTTLLGTAPVSGGIASLTIAATIRGSRAITAWYKGDTRLFGSISSVARPFVGLTAPAAIIGITDVAGDQGKQVRLSFTHSAYDILGSPTPITGYQVYRRSLIASALQATHAQNNEGRAADPYSIQLAGWDYVMTVPSATDAVYQVIVPTLADSNGNGSNRVVLFVRAITATIGVHYDSPADSGYSVDNLAPVPPVQLMATYQAGATQLHWARNSEHDFWYYKVYRGVDASFTPDAGNLIANLPDTGYVDAGPGGSYYKLSAVDRNGNESGFALVQGPEGSPTGVGPGDVLSFALDAVRPNPARAAHLSLSFTLPTSTPAKLELFDVSGRRAAAQDVGALGAGRHSVSFTNVRLAAGIYLVRLTQGSASLTQRIAIVE